MTTALEAFIAALEPTARVRESGKGRSIAISRSNGPDFAADYTWLDQLEGVGSDSAEHTDEEAVNLDSRYYYTPFLDTTYVQAPGSNSLTVKYVAARNVTATAYLWEPGAWGQADSETASKVALGSGIYVYEAAFSGLDADTIYKYTFTWTEGGSDEHTAVQTTRTWPEQEDIGDFSFIVYGDNRGDRNHEFREPHRDVVCLGIMNRGLLGDADYPPFILHVGDLVNDGGRAGQWIPHFFRPAGGLLGRVPVFPCIGNHEYNDDANATNYKTCFTLPNNERWYSFDYGKCHFICLDTNQASYFDGDHDPQWEWLIESDPGAEDGDLPDAHQAKVSGDIERIFVWFHQPPYSSGTHYGESQCRMIQQRLVPMFEDYDVDVAFSGHEHFYERASKSGVQYIVTGGGGAPRRNAGSCPYEGTGAVQRALYAGTDRPGHYCVVAVNSQTGRVEFEAYTDDQERIDHFTLK